MAKGCGNLGGRRGPVELALGQQPGGEVPPAICDPPIEGSTFEEFLGEGTAIL